MAKKQKQPKEYIAKVSIRIGSNEDGSSRYNFVKDKPILLTASEAKKYKNYL